MRRTLFAVVMFLIAFLLAIFLAIRSTKAQAMGAGGCHGGGGQDIVRIGASARRVLHDYLAEDYRRHCATQNKNRPAACHLTKPYYTSASFPIGVPYSNLPVDVMKKIGFVLPGVVYVQIGYTVYLVNWPDKIIHDSITFSGIF